VAERFPVVIVGGGHAGLAMSWQLIQDGIDHVVLERDTAVHSWRDQRWDSFCLVTPNWQCRLPGYPYAGPDPDGFMVKAEILDWLAGYIASFGPPIREHTPVLGVRPRERGGFDVVTSAGDIEAGQVVVATGGYHVASLPRLAERLPDHVVQVHSSRYVNPAQLPDGPVLVVGTGQSGAQIAEELQLTGHDVHVAVGTAPRFARRYRGRDVIAWLHDTGYYARPVTDKPIEERNQDRTNHYVTGRDGGRDIDLRRFAQEGMTLHGRLADVRDGRLKFAGDLAANLDNADAVYNGINEMIDEYIATQGLDVAVPPSRYVPLWQPTSAGPTRMDAAELAAVVWATGFRRDYSWLHAGVFDGGGHVQQTRGVTAVPGLYFLGLPWLHTWGSGRFAGIEVDAQHVAEHVRTAYRRSADLTSSLAS
jgi:putative flavoprotein involved in K+ transport